MSKALFEKKAPYIQTLKLGSKILVMNRHSGKSVFIPEDRIVFLKLLQKPMTELSSTLQPLWLDTLSELESLGLGQSSTPACEPLNTIILKVTDRCNYSCRYCYNHPATANRESMPISLAKEIITQALELCRNRLQIIFHGGEPLLEFNFIIKVTEFAEAQAKRLGKQVHFNGQTNLSLLNEDIISFSVNHNIHWGISLDGPAFFHDHYRVFADGTGTHINFEDKLAKFPDFLRQCGVKATITSVNQNNLLDISRYFQKRGLTNWGWSLYQPSSSCSLEGAEWEPEVLRKSWDVLLAAVESGEFNGFVISPIFRYLKNLLTGPSGDLCLRAACGAAEQVISVSVNGQLNGCDCFDSKGLYKPLGFFPQTSLVDALNSPAAAIIHSRRLDQGVCNSCFWHPLCGGTCAGLSKQISQRHEPTCRIVKHIYKKLSLSLAESDSLWKYYQSCPGLGS